MKPHVPRWATPEESANYLGGITGEQWPLTRLLEAMPKPSVWIEYSEHAPQELFMGRTEGFCAPMTFAGDMHRLQHTRTVGLTMAQRPDGQIVRFSKMIEFELSDLRFSRDDLLRVADLVGQEPASQPATRTEPAALFDPVAPSTLEKMFPDGGQWANHAERAARNGLSAAREGRGRFNPYLAAEWWVSNQAPDGWDRARCLRVLANNLPDRSRDEKHLLTGGFD